MAPPTGFSARANCPTRDLDGLCRVLRPHAARYASVRGRCGVCLKTAYTMRHRLIECLSAYSPSFRVERGCGLRTRRDLFPRVVQGQPREGVVHDAAPLPAPRQAGAQSAACRASRICVMTGSERLERDLLRGLGARRGLEGARHGRAEGPHRAPARSSRPTGRPPTSMRPRRARRSPRTRPTIPRTAPGGTINRVNTVHSLLGAFMEPFQGRVHQAPRRLPRLVQVVPDLHGDRLRRGAESHGRASARATASAASRIRDMFNVLPPYMDYWVAPAA